MKGFLVIVLLVTSTSLCIGEETMDLPKPHYRQEIGDPGWLAHAAQFHGHLGPWATAGLRMGMAGRRAIAADGYFDIDVTVSGPFAKPPKSCFLDGLQVSTGATWGKRNIRWQEGEAIVVRVVNTQSGKLVEIKPSAKLLELLASFKPASTDDSRDDHALEKVARKIALLPESQIVDLQQSVSDVPE